MIGSKIIRLHSIESTNSYLKNLIKSERVPEGTVVCTSEQTKGRGQRGNVWLSESHKNLLISFVLYPNFLTADQQFILSKIASLSLFDLLKKHLQNVKIKWPNDLYINNLKIAGILIENTLSGTNIDSTIVGMGLNVNQRFFDKSVPNPTSMSLQTSRSFDLEVLLNNVCENIDFWYNQLLNGCAKNIDEVYLNSLYRFGIKSYFEDKNGRFSATISNINKLGQICMIDETGNSRIYSFKEIVFCN